MQDRTIDSALVALARQGGTEGRLAEVLLEMRGVRWSLLLQTNPIPRGGVKRLCLRLLAERPHTASEIGAAIRKAHPEVTPRSGRNRAYQALVRLEDVGRVCRDGRFWRLAP